MFEKNGSPARPLVRYLASAIAIVVAFLLRLALVSALGSELPTYSVFYPAVVLVTLFAGLRAGLLSVGFSALIAVYFIHPSHGITVAKIPDLFGLLFFACMATFISAAIERYRSRWSEARLHAILESLSEGVVAANLDGRIRSWNRAALELHGYASQEDGKRLLSEVAVTFELSTLDGNVLPLDEWPLSRALRGEQFEDVECQVRRLDRDDWKRIFSYHGRRISGTNGLTSVAVITIRDITARKQAEAELIWKTAFLEAQTNSTVDGILVVDAAGKKILQNRAMSEMWNIPQSILDDSEDQSQVRFVMDQTEYPGAFRSRVEYLYEHPTETSREEIELKNGRVFDRYSGPVVGKNGENYGRIWSFRDITDRKRAEDTLRLSEERARVLFQSITDALMVHDILPDGTPGTFIEVNDVACQRLGYTRDELLAMSPQDIDTPGTEGNYQSISAQLMKGSDVVIEQTHVAKNGDRIPVEIHARLFSLRGRPTVVSLVHDLRQRRRAERDLHESEQRLAQAVNVAGLGIFEYDHATGAFLCSSAFKNMLGWDEHVEATLESVLAKVWPDDRPILLAAIPILLSDALQIHNHGSVGPTAVELRIVRPEGIGWLVVRAESFFEVDASSQHKGRTVGAVQDITKQKGVELRLSESQQQLQTAMDAAKLGVWSRDLKSRVISLDEVARNIYGWPPDQVVTDSVLLERIVPEDRALFKELTLPSEDAIGVEYRIDSPGNGIRWVSASGRMLRDSLGIATHRTGVVQDITEKKQAEQELSALEQQLRHSQKMEAVGRLAGGIAHDFNNLLMVIRSYTELMEETFAAHDPQRRSTRAIMKAADRAAGLTGQMLAFSRKQVLMPVTLDLNSAVSDCARMLRRVIGEDIELRVNLKSTWTVRADQDQISQVLMNLGVNARDAMPEGGTLTIETSDITTDDLLIRKYHYLPPGDYVVFSVTDSGTGITRDVQEHMFEPFFTTKSVGKGTGLGLSTVYGIVKQSGGYLLVDSEPGHGACFTIYLPRVRQEISLPDSMNSERLQRGTETILIVEDEDSLRESLCEFLSSLGYTILSANSGSQALSVSSQFERPIHLLISDVVMPKMSGRELSQMLTGIRPDIKTLFMSGYTDDAIVRHGVEQDGVAFLQKPFSLATLVRRVREVLGTPEASN
jgi:two-component system cell cycle sensor histidine kinase/response regulator CckA